MPKDLREELIGVAQIEGVSQSQIIIRALDYYITSQYCVFCGARNPAEGLFCSACGRPLFQSDIDMLRSLRSFKEELVKSKGLPTESITTHGVKVDSHYSIRWRAKNGEREYYLEQILFTEDGDILSPIEPDERIPTNMIQAVLDTDERRNYSVTNSNGEKITVKIENPRNWNEEK
ncbi:MAG TPA: zinc ribbon domain-containing protein [Methanocorpusculum sp.]|nr:zinc ribbon domain-containing protein [Methanocorpusculum sp.]